MSVLATMAPHQEVYSIDECFLDVAGFSNSIRYGQHIRKTIKKWLGLPVCVGIGSSKTLAKLGNFIAKKQPQYNGVFDFARVSRDKQDELMQSISVVEIWGIGSKLAQKLNNMGIYSVKDLRDSDPEQMHNCFSIVVKRTVLELRGMPCLSLEEIAGPRKQIISSRSFGTYVYDLARLEEAITSYASRAAVKLRQDGSHAAVVQAFIQTNRFSTAQAQYSTQGTVRLLSPTSDTMLIAKAAISIVRKLFRPGFAYQKVGVILLELGPAESRQLQLFDSCKRITKSQRLMELMDATNATMGRKTLYLAAEGHSETWRMKSEHMTPAYTTCWHSLPIANA